MSKITAAVNWAIGIALDDSHGYQWGGWGPEYDCGHLIIMAWENAGVHVRAAGASYTGDMRPAFLRCGFVDVTGRVNVNTGAGLQIGDVLVNQANHAAMYIGNGRLVQARSNVDGMPGDSSGQEIRTQSYYNFPWDCVLRYQESAALSGSGTGIATAAASVTQATPSDTVDADGYYTVKAGDTLWGIAQSQLGSGGRYQEIMTANNLTSAVIRVGAKLKIPGKVTATSAPTAAPANTQTAGTNAQTSVDNDEAALEAGSYTVQKGDTLWGIAVKKLGNGLRWPEIQKINGMKNTNIKPGQVLKLP